MDVLDSHQADEIGMLVVLVEGELDQPAQGCLRRLRLQMERSFDGTVQFGAGGAGCAVAKRP